VPPKGKATAALPPGRAETADPSEGGAEAANICGLAKSQAKAARPAARSAAATPATRAAASRT